MKSEKQRELQFDSATVPEVDVLKVENIFMRNGNRRLMQNLAPNSFFYHTQ